MGLTGIFTGAVMNTLGKLGFDDNAPAEMLGRVSDVGNTFKAPAKTFG